MSLWLCQSYPQALDSQGPGFQHHKSCLPTVCVWVEQDLGLLTGNNDFVLPIVCIWVEQDLGLLTRNNGLVLSLTTWSGKYSYYPSVTAVEGPLGVT